MPQTILITGASGLIGTRLTEMLLEKNYTLSHLSRKLPASPGKVKTYGWDVEKGEIDKQALQNAEAIIHLAGAGIADEKWTDERKQEIINSRTQSAKLILENLPENWQGTFISASAIGIYGGDSGKEFMYEDSPQGNDFLAEVCKQWEKAAGAFQAKGIRTVILRTGIVLSDRGGALPKLVQPIRLGAGAVLGSGEQIMSWIHLDDLCRMYIHALENPFMQGAYNAVAPNPVSNKILTRQAAHVLHKWVLPFPVPEVALKLVYGEMTEAILSNNNVSSEKISQAGFGFQFTDSEKALADLLK
jgi:uncharacterized protein